MQRPGHLTHEHRTRLVGYLAGPLQLVSARAKVEDDFTTAIGKDRMGRLTCGSAEEHPVVPDVRREVGRRLDASELEIQRLGSMVGDGGTAHSLHSPPYVSGRRSR